MTTSLISGLPRRETCTHAPTAFPFRTVTFWRSVAAQTPIVWLPSLSSCDFGICSAIEWTP